MSRSFYVQKRPSLDFPRRLASSRMLMVSPDLARLLLSKNPENRPVNNERVNELSKKILTGEWKDRGQGFLPVIVMKDGTVIDGQHRLCAIVQSGKAAKMRVWIMEKKVSRRTFGCADKT